MHAEPAADDHPGIGLADELQRDPLLRVGVHALADDRGTAAKGQKAPGAGDPLAIRHRLGDLMVRGVRRLRGGQHAELDQIAVGRGVGDVAGAQERRLGKGPAHAEQILGALRQHVGPRHPLAAGIGRRQQQVLPFGIEVAVVPEGIFLDHRLRCGVGGHVLDPPLAHDPDPPPVAQRLPVFAARPHRVRSSLSSGKKPRFGARNMPSRRRKFFVYQCLECRFWRAGQQRNFARAFREENSARQRIGSGIRHGAGRLSIWHRKFV